MRAVLPVLLLLVLIANQALALHVHQGHELHAHAHAGWAQNDSGDAWVHSHVLDAGSVDVDHLSAADEKSADTSSSRADTPRLPPVLLAVLAFILPVPPRRSARRVATARPRPAASPRPPICLRPAPQGPPR